MQTSVIINVAEAARLLGVRVDEVYRLIRSGKLKAFKGSKLWRINKADVEQRAAKRTNGRG